MLLAQLADLRRRSGETAFSKAVVAARAAVAGVERIERANADRALSDRGALIIPFPTRSRRRRRPRA